MSNIHIKKQLKETVKWQYLNKDLIVSYFLDSIAKSLISQNLDQSKWQLFAKFLKLAHKIFGKLYKIRLMINLIDTIMSSAQI